MEDFYAYNIRTKKKEKMTSLETGLMKIKGIEKDTSRYFVRGKILDGSLRYLFINEDKYHKLIKAGVKDAGTIIKHRKEKKKKAPKEKKAKKSKEGGRKKTSGTGKRRKSRSRSRSGGKWATIK